MSGEVRLDAVPSTKVEGCRGTALLPVFMGLMWVVDDLSVPCVQLGSRLLLSTSRVSAVSAPAQNVVDGE